MLEQKDIEMIKIAVGEAFNGRFDAIEQRMDTMEERMDKKFDAIDKKFDAMEQRMDAMEERMDKKFDAIDKKFDAIDKKFDAIDKKFDAMDKKFTAITKKHERRMDLILDEVVRVHEGLQGQINRVEKYVNEMKQYYRIDKLENDSMSILIQHVADLDKRVTRLENQPA